MLNIIHEIPSGLIDCDISDIHSILKGPTLIHLKGDKAEPLFISTLLHGNETTSFHVLQKLLKDFEHTAPSRDIIFFVGNTLAASKGLRQIEGQLDYNRIWKKGEAEEYQMTQKIVDYAKEHNVFGNIDIHNNTGNNPFYACINKIDGKFLHLASLFSKRIVYFTEPAEVESMAFCKLCPSVTIEAGISGNELSTNEAYNFIKKVLLVNDFNDDFDKKGINVFHTVARILVDKNIEVDFDNSETSAGLSFVDNIDDHNFNVIRRGQSLGKTNSKSSLKVIDNANNDITEIFFNFISGNIVANQNFIPSMLTKNVTVMKSDCMGYIMEKILSV